MLYRETIPVFVVGWNRGLRQYKSFAWRPESFCSVDVVCSWRCICRWLYIKSRTNFTACCCSVTDAVHITRCNGEKKFYVEPTRCTVYASCMYLRKTATFVVYIALNESFFVAETESVYWAVRTGLSLWPGRPVLDPMPVRVRMLIV